jgi:hypothetical protein
MKLIKMHVGATGAKFWFVILVYKGKSLTSISTRDNLAFVKHIYVDVKTDGITVRLRFMQQDWAGRVGAAGVGQSRDE